MNEVKYNNPASPRCVLIAFHHAGGTGSIFRPWAKRLEEENIALICMNLPARTPTETAPAWMATIFQVIEKNCEQVLQNYGGEDHLPTVVFGHSLGGIIAYEVARRLRGKMHISHVIISASKDPATLTDECICPDKGNKHHLADGELFDYFVSIGGLLEGVHPDILRVLLPIARSDYKLFENYLFKDPRIILATPMTTFFGSADEPETLACIVKWAGYTTKSTRNVSFDGGNHFYFVDEKHRERVLQEIVNICAAAANE